MKQAVDVYGEERWRAYLYSRLVEYRHEVCSAHGLDTRITSAELVLPASFNVNSVIDHDFDQPVFEPCPPARGGWRLRDDAYLSGAERLQELSTSEGKSFLICHSAYSKPTDPGLQKRPHLVYESQVFRLAEFGKDTAADAAKTLRQSRSDKVFAILTDLHQNPCEVPSGSIFCTDVFDGEVLIVFRVQ